MQVDLVLPTLSFVFLNLLLWTYPRVKPRLRRFMEEGELRIKDAIGLVLILAVVVAILAITPASLLMLLSLAGIGFVLNLTSLIFTGNRWISLILPIIFYLCFFFFWNLGLLNLFALILALGTSLILSSVFPWKSSIIFVALLSIIDIIHVFGTEMMVEVGQKGISLGLPIMLLLPAYPAEGYLGFGLGDLFVAGLLSVKNWERFGRKAGLITSIHISIFIGLLMPFLDLFGVLPATVFIFAGWLTSYLQIIAMGLKPKP